MPVCSKRSSILARRARTCGTDGIWINYHGNHTVIELRRVNLFNKKLQAPYWRRLFSNLLDFGFSPELFPSALQRLSLPPSEFDQKSPTPSAAAPKPVHFLQLQAPHARLTKPTWHPQARNFLLHSVTSMLATRPPRRPARRYCSLLWR